MALQLAKKRLQQNILFRFAFHPNLKWSEYIKHASTDLNILKEIGVLSFETEHYHEQKRKEILTRNPKRTISSDPTQIQYYADCSVYAESLGKKTQRNETKNIKMRSQTN